MLLDKMDKTLEALVVAAASPMDAKTAVGELETSTAQTEQQASHLLTTSPDTVDSPSAMPPADAKEHLRAIGVDQSSAVECSSSTTTSSTSITVTTTQTDSSNSASNTASNGSDHIKTDDANDDNDDDDEVVVTLDDVLRQDAMLTETADAVLGASSESDCSYPLGHIRQALYACLTCTPATEDESTRAGICLACSYNCHEGHELIELYTKRHFRCDCGNAKFPATTPCKLVSDKAPQNNQNAYSQNFSGRYCICHRPYPDPERTTDEVMLQCVVCEDWLHAEHVFTNDDASTASGDEAESQRVPDDFDDFICAACMAKHPFLLAYDMDDDGDVENHDAITTTDPASTAATCLLAHKLAAMAASDHAAALETVRPTFWTREWRDALCKCSDCVRRFENHDIAFLLDPEDSLQAYEEAAAAARLTTGGGSPEDLAQRAFAAKLSHQQQVEMAIGYSHMKTSLQTYLAGFAAGNKTVRAEDIQSFFEGLREQKRHKTAHEHE